MTETSIAYYVRLADNSEVGPFSNREAAEQDPAYATQSARIKEVKGLALPPNRFLDDPWPEEDA